VTGRLLSTEEAAELLGVPARWPLEQARPGTFRLSGLAAMCDSTVTTWRRGWSR
jgi:hypothetical protein